MWLEFASVTCGYNGTTPVLEDVSVRVGPGLWAVTGPNGAGKSTLLRCAAGLLPPAAGQLLWIGEDAYRLDSRFRWHVGYAPQELGGYPELTAEAYLTYLAALKGVRSGLRTGRVREVFAMTGLVAEAHRPMPQLSGGMKTRLGLAQALLNDPDLLLLDEPSAGLDPAERAHLHQLLVDLSADRIILMATNLPDEVEGIVDGFIRLAGGRLLAPL